MSFLKPTFIDTVFPAACTGVDRSGGTELYCTPCSIAITRTSHVSPLLAGVFVVVPCSVSLAARLVQLVQQVRFFSELEQSNSEGGSAAGRNIGIQRGSRDDC